MLFSLLLNCLLFSANTYANPEGGSVVAGDATIASTDSKTVQVNQSSDKVIIDWHSFNINADEHTHFQQPAHGIALNRIDPDQGMSKIYGSLTSTGMIVLVNQAGIYIGPGALIDVGGIIASTQNISNDNFLAGKYIFDQPAHYFGSIINRGMIHTADYGLVALLGTAVDNDGYIDSHLGTIILSSGKMFTLNFSGEQLIHFVVGQDTENLGLDENGNPLRSSISNSGVLLADGGKILVSANAVSHVLDHVINMSGVAEARSVYQQNGEIILSGGHEGVVKVSGTLNASGQTEKNSGGMIHITGHQILLNNAQLSANGGTGGGEILIGGDFHGAGILGHAEATVIDSGTLIEANALNEGYGGNIAIWSDQLTKFYGTISARGGTLSGNGGFVETSSENVLEALGNVDASASNGLPGSWLLDPSNVTISTASTANGSFNGSSPNTFTTTANNAVANVSTINTALNNGTSVTIQTTPSGTQAGNITVSSPVLKSASASSATLTLNAAGSITLSNTISSTSGALNVTLIGDSLTLNSAVTTNGGNFLSTIQNAITLANTINTAAGTVSLNANQDGAGSQGISMNAGSSITTTNTLASAINLNVNTNLGGTGGAALRDMTTGSGGTINIQTNSTGGNITMAAGTLNVGAGTISLTTPQTSGKSIGTSTANLTINASNLSATTGSSGIFITNLGTNTLQLGAINTSGAFSLTSTSSSSIENSGILTISGTTTIAAGATHDVILNNASNRFGTIAITSGNNVNANSTGAVILGASTVSGRYQMTAGGSITQSGILTIAGTPTFTVTTANADISLATQANIFSVTPVLTNNGNVRDVLLRNVSASASVPNLPVGLRNVTLTFNNASALQLPALNISGALSVTSNGPVTQSGALTIAGISTIVAGSENDITLNNTNNDFSTIAITSGHNVSLADMNALILGASTINGTLNVTTGGALSDSGKLSVVGATALDAGINSITLNTNTNDFNTVSVTSGNNVTLVDSNAIALGSINTTGTLSVTSSGAITQVGVISSIGTATFSAGNANNITLNTYTNHFSTIRFTTANNVSVSNDTAVTLGTSTISNALNVTAAGSISQNGVLTIIGMPTFTLTTANSDISLASQANNFSITPNLTNNGNVRDVLLRNINVTATVPNLPTGLRNVTLTLNNASALQLPAINTSGNLLVTSNGPITQSGALTIAGTSTFAAGSGNDITLNNAENNFLTVNISSGKRVSLTDINDLNLGASTVSDTLSVVTNGALTDSGKLSVIGETTIHTNANNITLNTTTNDFSTISILSGNNVTLTDTNAIILNSINAMGTLNVTSKGAITQSGSIQSLGSATFSAGSANNITLDNINNDFSSINITSGNNVSLTDINALTLGASTVSGAFNVVTGGDLSDSGKLSISGITTLAAGENNITLNTATNNFSTISVLNGKNVTLVDSDAIILGAINAGGTLNITSNGAITQNGLIEVVGTATFSAGSANDIVLDSFPNKFSAIDINSANNVVIKSENDMTIDASGVSSNLTITSSGMTFNNIINIPNGSLILDAGTSGNIIFNDNVIANNITIQNVNDFTNNATVKVNSFLQQAGNTSLLGYHTLNVTNDATITANSVSGAVNVGSLALNVNQANLTGSVGGETGLAAVQKIMVNGSTSLGALSFDGIHFQIPALLPTIVAIMSTLSAVPVVNQVISHAYIVNTESTIQQTQMLSSQSSTASHISNLPMTYPMTQRKYLQYSPIISSKLFHLPMTFARSYLSPKILLENSENVIWTLLGASVSMLLLSQLRRIKKPMLNLINAFQQAALIGPETISWSNMLFELRTSLTTIMGFAKLMEKESESAIPDSWKEYLSSIVSDSTDLEKIIVEVQNYVDNPSKSIEVNKFQADLTFKLRTSLTGIMGFAKLMYDDTVNQVSIKYKEYVSNIISGANEILHLFHPETGLASAKIYA
ncbi:MAG: hypothetical protein SFW66_03255 [Gammaproteobacteria bacterium]|nr:hypothetical protein [Gammaproteobacteria bacterium]